MMLKTGVETNFWGGMARVEKRGFFVIFALFFYKT